MVRSKSTSSSLSSFNGEAEGKFNDSQDCNSWHGGSEESQ